MQERPQLVQGINLKKSLHLRLTVSSCRVDVSTSELYFVPHKVGSSGRLVVSHPVERSKLKGHLYWSRIKNIFWPANV